MFDKSTTINPELQYLYNGDKWFNILWSSYLVNWPQILTDESFNDGMAIIW